MVYILEPSPYRAVKLLTSNAVHRLDDLDQVNLQYADQYLDLIFLLVALYLQRLFLVPVQQRHVYYQSI